ncbi:MAG: hypothetical protein Q7T55_00725 [Solirubrobacteraceae bacterium]|nr:hypothetical protein [Solirubrobacteraceae bacterium]
MKGPHAQSLLAASPRVASRAPVVPAPASLAAQELEALLRRRQVIVADLPSPGPDPDGERRLASALAGKVDLALLGDAPWARLQLPPAVRASIVAGEGLRPWAALDCRDRTQLALRSELAALAAVGAPAVHCTTGRPPQLAPGSEADGVFELDGIGLASLAAQTGLVVSVAESSAAPPIHTRPLRAATKAEAGAGILFVTHTADPKSLAHFVAVTRAMAPKLRILVRLPMVISRAGAERLAAIWRGPLPAWVLEPLESRDPAGASISAVAEVAADRLGIDGVDGIALTAPAGADEELEVARALAGVGQILGGGS